MCVLLNQELAVVGLLNEIAEEVIRKNQRNQNIDLQVEGVDVTPQIVMNYCNWLTGADCGPILKNFNTVSVEKLFEEKTTFFRKKSHNVFTIRIHEYYQNRLPDPDLDSYAEEFRKILIKEFVPDMNYPRSFLKYMKLCD